MTPQRVIRRLINNVERAEGGCIVSLYSVGSHGYSQIGWTDNRKTKMALGHRVAWEAVNGLIPDDLTIDHICRNRRCINVDHLRMMTNVENARGNGASLKTHCPAGHPYEGDNLHIDRKGHRRCRQCAVLRKKVA